MTEFRRVYSGVPWEESVGYCRAIRVGNQIAVTGTAPLDEDGRTHAPGDGYAQATRCFQIIRRALLELDSDLDRVIRTRLYVTDISRGEEYGLAHKEAFAGHPPATTMVAVAALIDPQMLVEIEVDAVA